MMYIHICAHLNTFAFEQIEFPANLLDHFLWRNKKQHQSNNTHMNKEKHMRNMNELYGKLLSERKLDL